MILLVLMAVAVGMNYPSPIPSREAEALAALVIAGKLDQERAVERLAQRYLPRGLRTVFKPREA